MVSLRTVRLIFGGILLGFVCLLACYILWSRWFHPAGASAPLLLGEQLSPQITGGDFSDSLVLIAVGDIGTGDGNQQAVADAMESVCKKVSKVDGIILLGDNFYQEGVDGVESPLWDAVIFSKYAGPCLRHVPFFPVFGNHDYKGNITAQLDKSAVESRWRFPYPFYRVAFGSLLQLVQMDSNFLTFCLDASRCSLDFLHDALASHNRSKFHWTLVSAHHPIQHSGAKHNDPLHVGLRLRSMILRQLTCQKADVYLSGHVHHLEYFYDHSCGVHHVISGGGGASLYEIDDEASQNPSEFIAREHGFMLITAKKESLTQAFYDKNALLLFEHQILR